MENIPCPKTLGCPAACAAGSSWCIGLKSPDAPAYLTRSVLVSLCVRTGASSPTATSSKDSLCSPTVRIPSASFVVHLRLSLTCDRRSSTCVVHRRAQTRWSGPDDQVVADRCDRLARLFVLPVHFAHHERHRLALG